MNNFTKLIASAFLSLSLFTTSDLPAAAHDTTAGDLTIVHPVARPNLPNRPTAAYMVIANDGETDDKLIAARSEAFETVEMHTVKKDGDVMQMLPVPEIVVPSNDAATLEPGGLHLMLFGGKQPYKLGDSFPLTLIFETAGELTVEVKIEKIAGGGHAGHAGHGENAKKDKHSGHGGHSGHGSTND